MNFQNATLTLKVGETVKIRLPERAGLVTIATHYVTADGQPRMRVDVESDTPRHGPADDGLSYTVENADPGPGVVWVTGCQPDQDAQR